MKGNPLDALQRIQKLYGCFFAVECVFKWLPFRCIARRQLLQDFELFERRMRLKYMFHHKRKEVHPFHVKSNWNPPVQKSVALESFLEEVKTDLAEIKILSLNITCHATNEKH